MTVSEGPGGAKTRITKTAYPYTEGLTAGTTKQTKDPYLKPESSNVRSIEKVGM